jgi:DNA invertase Pin-like site-specific DNA recombinase
MYIGYIRVSTWKQAEGNGLDVQEKEILNKYPGIVIYKEQHTGKTTDRLVLKEVMAVLQESDTLIVSKLDRLARNTVEGIQIVEDLFRKGVAVHVLNIGLLENTSMGKFLLTTLLAIAEMERNTILERTHAGKEIARQKPDYREGRPKKYAPKQMEHALKLLEANSYKQVEALTGISKSTLIRAMRG